MVGPKRDGLAAGVRRVAFLGWACAAMPLYTQIPPPLRVSLPPAGSSPDAPAYQSLLAYCQDPANAALLECTPGRGIDPLRTQERTTGHGLSGTEGRQMEEAPTGRSVLSYRMVEKPTEFQRYVKSSTGQILPIFGASLFDQVPSTFAPVDRVPVSAGYVIGPGDEVQVRAWGKINFSQTLTVERNGGIYLREVGPVQVAGLTFSQLSPAIKSAIGRVYHDFELNVSLGELRSMQVFVVGQARRPGSYTLSSLSTLVNALFVTGGPSSYGSLRHVQLKRGEAVVSEFDLYDLLLHGDKSKDVALHPGDVLFIPPIGPQVALTGSVEYPGIYELKDQGTLAEVLQFAGGLSPLAASKSAVIERVAASFKTLDISLDAVGLATPVENGDVVRISDVVARFDNAVTLRGNVATPRRFAWLPGMKVSDLIPNKEALLTRDYWRERNGLTLGSPETDDPATGSARGRFLRDETSSASGDRSLGAAQSSSAKLTFRTFETRTQVQQAAPDIDWDYAVVERRDPSTLVMRLIPFHLGHAVIDRETSEDQALEPGDVVTIFSKADISGPIEQRSRYVRVEGEIARAGAYSVLPGETLRALAKRAGGLTANAYLYGAQFTRQSTQKEQQQRFNEFLDSLESQINTTASNLAGRVQSVDQVAVTQSTITSQRSLVQKLRETPASGRIILALEPSATGVDVLPDLPLEDGDRLYVPSRPSTVNVVGTVYNQASFIFGKDLRVGNYLQQAGGPSRFADRSHMFVIRADGSVVAKPPSPSLFGRRLETLAMFPGDTLVVPTYVNKITFLRGLTDWSQVIANFALGVAAVNVLK